MVKPAKKKTSKKRPKKGPTRKAPKRASKKYYALDDEERVKILGEIRKSGQEASDVMRFKGLGEMNPDQLFETTMNPANRILKHVTVQDAENANRTFEMLMGEEVPPRKKFIQTHAKEAELDV